MNTSAGVEPELLFDIHKVADTQWSTLESLLTINIIEATISILLHEASISLHQASCVRQKA